MLPRLPARSWGVLRASAFPSLMLALALGAVLALFSLLHQVVLKPLPVPGQERLVALEIRDTYPDGRQEEASPSPRALRELGSFPWLEAGPVQYDIKYLRVDAGGLTRSALVAHASADFFSALGLLPAQGRLFAPGDPEPGLVYSWAAWRRLGGTLALGSRVHVDGVSLPLLGVLPEGFTGFWPGYEPDCWIPLEARVLSGDREARVLQSLHTSLPTFGRLKPGYTIAQANAAYAPFVASLRALPDEFRRTRREPDVQPLRTLRLKAWGHFLPSGPLLWVASGLLLLMAAVNLGNLQVARWMAERETWATRVALGASPFRLVLEMSRPILLNLVLGALLALPVAWFLGALLARFPPPSEYPVVIRMGMEGRVLAAAGGLVALLALPLLGMAWLYFMRHTCRVVGRQKGGGLRWRKALLGVQLALSVLLLSGTLGSLRELRQARGTDLGMDLRGIHAFSFTFPTHVPGDRWQIRALWTRLSEHFRDLPGLETASVMLPPCEGYKPSPSHYRNAAGQGAGCLAGRIHAGTFKLLRIPILLGRDFEDGDTPEGRAVAIVSLPLARAFWPDQSPLGQTVEDDAGRRAEVVGVVADHRWEGPSNPHRPIVFHSSRQRLGVLQTLLVRSPLPPARLYPWIEREVARLDPRLAIQRAEPLAERLERQLQPQRLAATLFGMLGTAALVLCLLGLYTLQHHLTVQRLPEAGLRMALGAAPGRVRREFLRALAWPVGLGLGSGLLGTLGAWRLLQAAVPGLPGLGPATLGGVLLGLLVTGLLAALLPLRRLDRSEPAGLLREQG